MVRANDRLQFSGNGPSTMVFLRTGTETVGAVLEMEATYPSQSSFPPEHYHPEQEERFAILDGALTVRAGGETRTYRAGDSFVLPRGVAHTMRNAGAEEARARWEVRPALRTDQFFASLAAAGEANGTLGRVSRLAATLREYRREFVLTRPPLALQRPLFGLLARLGNGRAPSRREVRERIEIHRPAEEVFAYVSDYERDPRWRAGVSAMSQSMPGQAVVGTVTRETMRSFGQQLVTTARIVALDPGRSIAFASIEGPIAAHGHRAIEATAAGSAFTYYLAADLTGPYRLIGPLLERDIRRRVRGDLQRLKGLLER